MTAKTSIEWTDVTWNSVRGCSIVSKGCTNCYAMKQAHRFSGAGGPYEGLTKLTAGGPVWTGNVDLRLDALAMPLRWRKPRRVFVNSMSDLFHEDVPAGFVDRVFAAMALCPQHTFQILTKRPARMRDYVTRIDSRGGMFELIRILAKYHGGRKLGPGTHIAWPMHNVWLGVSVEDQATADERIPLLLETPAAVRFVSYEPALGPVNFTQVRILAAASPPFYGNALYKSHWCPSPLDWVIVGGESGPGARPFDVRWVRQIVKQCRAAGVPLFVKQMGRFVIDRNDAGFEGDEASNWPAVDVDETPYGYITGGQGDDCRVLLKDRKGGDMSEWPEDLRVREFPEVRT